MQRVARRVARNQPHAMLLALAAAPAAVRGGWATPEVIEVKRTACAARHVTDKVTGPALCSGHQYHIVSLPALCLCWLCREPASHCS